ncbi:MAG TPA: hypothetical protein VM262_06635 [Acidimicrobiales bacterium]|nr:hypothetical protein [Acidimicrobiales bacterium]
MGGTLHFVTAARAIAEEARRAGLVVPGFRTPPRRADADRTLRRRPGAAPAVAVRLAGRPMTTVVADMVEGVLVANAASDRDDLRARLLAAVAA